MMVETFDDELIPFVNLNKSSTYQTAISFSILYNMTGAPVYVSVSCIAFLRMCVVLWMHEFGQNLQIIANSLFLAIISSVLVSKTCVQQFTGGVTLAV